jgi:TolA-binding protein
MKKLCCMLALVAGLGLLAGLRAADDPPKKADADSAAKARGHLPPNWNKIGLSEDQKKKIYKIEGDASAQINDLKKKIEQLQADSRTEMLKVLSDDQKTKLKELAVGEKPAEKKP